MESEVIPRAVRCQECGAEWAEAQSRCWLCGGRMKSNASRSVSPPATVTAIQTFSVESILLVVTLIAVCLGVTMQSPGIGIALSILSVPALIRAIGIRLRRKAGGKAMTAGEKILTFVTSLAVVTTMAAAGVVAFTTICFPTALVAVDTESVVLMVAAWVIGLLVALAVVFFLGRLLWRRKG